MTAYATLNDVWTLAIPQSAVSSVSSATWQAALDAANSEADGYLGSRFTLPITAWGMDLRMNVAVRAAWTMLIVQGFNPDSEAEKAIRDRARDALSWFKGITEDKVTPQVTSSGVDPGVETEGPFMLQRTTDDFGNDVLGATVTRGW